MAAEPYTPGIGQRERKPHEADLVGLSLQLPAPERDHVRHRGGSGHALFAAHKVAAQNTKGRAEGNYLQVRGGFCHEGCRDDGIT